MPGPELQEPEVLAAAPSLDAAAGPAAPETTSGQRGWKRHPAGMRVGSGGSPDRMGRSIPSVSGTTSSNALVYGWSGRVRTSSAGPISTIRPEVHHGDAIGDRPRETEVVRDDDDRDLVVIAELHQQLEDLAPDRGVEAGDGLVGHDHLGFEHQRPRDHHALSLAARQLVRVQEEESFGRTQTRAGERPGDELLLGLTRRSAVDPMDAQSLRDDLVDRLTRVQGSRRVLEDHLHPAPVRAEVLAERTAR